MLRSLDRALKYRGRGKYGRQASASRSRLRMGWMVPMLAVCSLFLNRSLHLRRTSRRSAIERGPRATNVPTLDQPTRRRKPQRKLETTTISTETQANTVKTHYSNLDLSLPKKKKGQTSQTLSTGGPKKTKKKIMRKRKREATTTLTSAALQISSVKAQQDAKIKVPDSSSQGLSPNATISACLLVRDDNDIMNEWLAYHYHVLKLRRLIVAVDPHSETSPAGVLNKWKEYMDIDLWTDGMYMPKDFLETGVPPDEHVENITKFGAMSPEEMIGVNAHRYRQKIFLGRCFQMLKHEQRTLVVPWMPLQM